MALFKKPYQIVVVDDDPDICDFIVEILESKYGNKLEIKSFISPIDAFEHIKKNNEIALVISDMKMAGLSGGSFLNMCRDLQRGIKTISITGNQTLAVAVSRYRDGDIGFLLKPFREEELYKLLDMVIEMLQYWERQIRNVVDFNGK